MELFYSNDIEGSLCRLGNDESMHCIKVLRHRSGDMINIIDGKGTLMKCRLIDDSPKGASAEIIGAEHNWGGHPYHLTLAVAPTKNADRYEWFAEKACEIGVDCIVPVIGQYSERKVFKTARVEKILTSAAKQSLKGAIPQICPPLSVNDFIQASRTDEDGTLKMIAYCFEDSSCPRRSIKDVLANFSGDRITVMIGPEGDFSPEEAESAVGCGFIPVHLGTSRLRTETAGITAAEAVYFRYMQDFIYV